MKQVFPDEYARRYKLLSEIDYLKETFQLEKHVNFLCVATISELMCLLNSLMV